MEGQGMETGCPHYKRRSKFLTPCCKKIYYCRFCHDENESHELDRNEVTTLVCAVCDRKQKVQEQCEECKTRFGKYACLKCRLFDDEEKKQFHCDGCGICRIGGCENFFHCNVCNLCLNITIKYNHKCIENSSRTNCPICLINIHESRTSVCILDCGHLIHTACYEKMLQFGHRACPYCLRSM